MYLHISHLPSCTLSLGLYVNDLVFETISFFLFLSVMASRCHLSPEGRLFVGIRAAENSVHKHRGWRLITGALYGGGSPPRTMLNGTKSGHCLYSISCRPEFRVLPRHQVAFVYRVISSNDVLLLSFVAEPRLLLCRFGRTPSLRPRGLTVRSTSRQF